LSTDRLVNEQKPSVEFLGLEFDCVGTEEAANRLIARQATDPFIYVVTPNVDHIVRMGQGSPGLRRLYEQAELRLCDSRILSFLARIVRIRLPVATGSDLTAHLFSFGLSVGDNVCVIGGSERLLQPLIKANPKVRFLHHMPPMGLRDNPHAIAEAAAFVAASAARYSFLAVGSPQQEMVAGAVAERGDAVGVGLCVGAAIEFLTGERPRAPKLIQRIGMEWAYRLVREPKRVWRRYLVEDPAIFPIFWRWYRDRRPLTSTER
jgi:N-acetylglucosaminyldiphosphoundecaprenol N-acetyl-beta-D-mannosaminyltransferase